MLPSILTLFRWGNILQGEGQKYIYEILRISWKCSLAKKKKRSNQIFVDVESMSNTELLNDCTFWLYAHWTGITHDCYPGLHEWRVQVMQAEFPKGRLMGTIQKVHSLLPTLSMWWNATPGSRGDQVSQTRAPTFTPWCEVWGQFFPKARAKPHAFWIWWSHQNMPIVSFQK